MPEQGDHNKTILSNLGRNVFLFTILANSILFNDRNKLCVYLRGTRKIIRAANTCNGY